MLGPAFGFVGVGFASALSGHAAARVREHFEARSGAGGGNGRRRQQQQQDAAAAGRWWAPLALDEALLDSLLGAVLFKAMGGRFRGLMPSDLAAPGALAFESIPARGGAYAQPGMKRELLRIFRRDGCHHCGAGGGVVVGAVT